MSMTTDDYKSMINIAQTGNEVDSQLAITDILFDIIDYHMDKHLFRYYRKATVGGMDEDDMRQIFLIAASEAIQFARTDVGNPLMYIIQKGKWAVVDELRKTYRRAIRQYCHKCNTETRLLEKGGVAYCGNCNSNEYIERIMVDALDDGEAMMFVESAELMLEDKLVSELLLDGFRETLGGRTLEVFDKIMIEGYDRDSCSNYIKEIAATMEVTTTNINLRLRKIKEAWRRFELTFYEMTATDDKPNEEEL